MTTDRENTIIEEWLANASHVHDEYSNYIQINDAHGKRSIDQKQKVKNRKKRKNKKTHRK